MTNDDLRQNVAMASITRSKMNCEWSFEVQKCIKNIFVFKNLQ